jgi:transglutaminase-like putative cysteine protease
VLYAVRHVTDYLYADSVPTSHHDVHLLPRAVDGQTVRSESLTTIPVATLRRDRRDWFGNRVTHLAIHERHKRLTVTSQLTIEVSRPPVPRDDGPWDGVRDWVRAGADPEAREALELVLPSPRVALTADALAYAKPSFPAGRPLADAARELMTRIHKDFVYDQTATDVSTPVDLVMKNRRGVCQDFAHVLLSCLRALGLPARYISGYLVTRPDGGPRLVGTDASHAWASLRLPGGFWLDLDPTNDVVPGNRHITIAEGRDFGDVTPMRGVILGGGRHELRVGVDVSRADDLDG